MATTIEGKRAVLEALRDRIPISCVFIADNLRPDSLIEDIERKARHYHVHVKRTPRKKLDELSKTGKHQGVIAQAKDFAYTPLQSVIDAAQASADAHLGRALVILLDHINDAGNLGAIARSADAVGAAGLVIPNKRQASVTPATYKSSAGAIAHLKVARVANLAQALTALQKAGFWAAACYEKATDVIWDVNLKGKIALIVGNEHEGISPLLLKKCDFTMKLPQFGQVDSLNVAQASTACAYEWLRQHLK